MRNFPVAKEAWPYAALLVLFALILYFLFRPLAAVMLFAAAGVVFFFRNPKRKVPEEGIIVSPADGKVMYVETVEETEFIKGPAQKISIFLNVFNVHINRVPLGGVVRWVRYYPGKHRAAFHQEADLLNERNYVAIEGECKVLVVQIAGLVARRVVCDVREGQRVETGSIFGLIKFGSCTQVYLPLDVEVMVGSGQVVRGGETAVGRLSNAKTDI